MAPRGSEKRGADGRWQMGTGTSQIRAHLPCSKSPVRTSFFHFNLLSPDLVPGLDRGRRRGHGVFEEGEAAARVHLRGWRDLGPAAGHVQLPAGVDGDLATAKRGGRDKISSFQSSQSWSILRRAARYRIDPPSLYISSGLFSGAARYSAWCCANLLRGRAAAAAAPLDALHEVQALQDPSEDDVLLVQPRRRDCADEELAPCGGGGGGGSRVGCGGDPRIRFTRIRSHQRVPRNHRRERDTHT